MEEVRKQIGLDGNISDILQQFGAGDTGKISYDQFCENSQILFGDQACYTNSSESSPEYCSTDSEAAVNTSLQSSTTAILAASPTQSRLRADNLRAQQAAAPRGDTVASKIPIPMASHDKPSSRSKKDANRKGILIIKICFKGSIIL